MTTRWRPSAFALFIGLAVHAAAWAQPTAAPPLPPLQQPPSQDHHAGKVIDELLATPDLAAAKQFYGGLFGWTFQDINLGSSGYVQAYLEGHAVAGFVGRSVPAGAPRRPAWLTLISNADVSTTQATAGQAGAKLQFGPRDIPGLGQEAIMTDPQGAPFGILASNSGDPADVLVPAGGWIWHALFAPDPDTEAAFYQALFHYDVFGLPGRNERQHLVLASEDFARASVNPLPPGWTSGAAYWLGFVRVASADAAAAKAASLGGRVLVQPRLDRSGGKLAVLADPTGAAFGVMEWTESTDTGSAK